MNEPQLGKAYLEEGELSTLYYEGRKGYTSKSLLALKAFSLSDAMAAYYKVMSKRLKSARTEHVLEDISLWLEEEGYVRVVTPKLLKIGNAGRLPDRIKEEWKYQQNPSEFLIRQIERYFETYSISIIAKCGQYLILVDPSTADDELSVEVYHDDEYMGLVRFGVYGENKRSLVIYDEDREQVKLKLLEMIEEMMPGANLTLGRVYYNPSPIGNVPKREKSHESTSC